MFGDEKLDVAVEKYIAEGDPAGLNGEQKEIIDAAQDLLHGFENDIKYERFLMMWKGQTVIPDITKKQIAEGTKILEEEGPKALKKWVKNQKFGVRKAYNIGEVQQLRLGQATGKAALAQGHLHAREDFKQNDYDRTFLERFTSYYKQMSKRVELKPLWDAYTASWKDAAPSFSSSDQKTIDGLLERNRKEIIGIIETPTVLEKWLVAGYTQMARTLFADVYKGLRNTFQNVAINKQLHIYNFKGWKDVFLGKKTTKEDWDHFDKQVNTLSTWHQDMLFKQHGNQPLIPVLHNPIANAIVSRGKKIAWPVRALVRTTNRFSDFINVMGHTDKFNRAIAFKASVERTRGFLEEMGDPQSWSKEDLVRFMKKTNLLDLTHGEQRHALRMLVTEGPDAFVQFLGEHYTQLIHFNYQRGARSPSEQGSSMARVLSNLVTFKKGYVQRSAFAIDKMRNAFSKDADQRILEWAQFANSAYGIFSLIGVGYLVGELFKELTNSRNNPYAGTLMLDPTVGALPIAAQVQVGSTVVNMTRCFAGDGQACSRAIVDITKSADVFIPFYKTAFDVFEGITHTRSVDRSGLRDARAAFNKRMRKKFPDWDHYSNNVRTKKMRDLHNQMTKMFLGKEDTEQKGVRSTKGKSAYW